MTKRILILGIAMLAMAMLAPAIGLGGISVSGGVAQAQDPTDPAAPDQTDPSDTAPDQTDPSDTTPDQTDPSDTAPGDDSGDSGGDAEDGPCPSSGARASGDSCPPPAQQPAQPAPQPAPQPKPKPKKRSHKHRASGSGGGKSAGSETSQSATPIVQATTPVAQGVDTGTIPTGGIQAGAGGTADDGSSAGLIGGTALILVALAGGGFALRRRHDLAS